MENTVRQITAVMVVLIALFVAWSFMGAQPNKPIGQEDVQTLVLNDVHTDFPDAKIKFLSTVRNGDSWNTSVKISLDGGSPCCPQVYVRHYELLPIRYREELVVSSCIVGDLIFLEEEAVVASCRDSYVSSIAKERLPTTTRFLEQEVDAAKACVDCTELQEFLKTAPSVNLWVVEWTKDDAKAFVAISDQGKVLAVKR